MSKTTNTTPDDRTRSGGERVPNPGSEAAIADGCTCPVIDNHYGKGMQYRAGARFWISGDCPLHGASGEVVEGGDGNG